MKKTIYLTEYTISSESFAVVEERSHGKRHAEQHDAKVDEAKVKDQDIVMVVWCPSLQDGCHSDKICQNGSDHENRVHGGFYDPCDFFVRRKDSSVKDRHV